METNVLKKQTRALEMKCACVYQSHVGWKQYLECPLLTLRTLLVQDLSLPVYLTRG